MPSASKRKSASSTGQTTRVQARRLKFAAQAARQSQRVASSAHAARDQAFVNAISSGIDG